MKRYIRQIEILKSDDPKLLQEKVNAFVLDKRSVEFQYSYSMGIFTVLIDYEELQADVEAKISKKFEAEVKKEIVEDFPEALEVSKPANTNKLSEEDKAAIKQLGDIMKSLKERNKPAKDE